jgi:hypothetical protein
MECNKVKELIDLYITGDVDSKTYEDINLHLSECPHCKQEYAEYKNMLLALTKLKITQLDTQLQENMWEQIKIRIKIETRIRTFLTVALQYAAILIIGICFGLLVYSMFVPKTATEIIIKEEPQQPALPKFVEKSAQPKKEEPYKLLQEKKPEQKILNKYPKYVEYLPIVDKILGEHEEDY